MKIRFDPQENLVFIRAKIFGPKGRSSLLLALDTGASSTLISRKQLRRIGYDLAASSSRVQMTTGSGVELVPRISVSKFSTLGQERNDFSVIAHDLPPSAGIDGLLGLDFFRGQNLNIDFRNGLILLS
ncbi:MAG: retropepsin-like domain-containing protein [Acidobacteriota bacterium]|nr:retropepsin-like domain-containing protein [Acidobacteriota bacterium]